MNESGHFPVVIAESLDLLAQAALAPTDEARRAWQAWRKAYDIDNTPWSEVRMLGAVAARIDELEPGAAIRPRMLGIRKFLWVQSQICLKNAASGLVALNHAGIPALLMKGAARIALDPSTAQERLIRDVDILVPLGRENEAFESLQGSGWSLVEMDWQVALRRWAPVAGHHAWSLSKGKSEIDLHHFSNNLNRLRGDDDQLWSRSVPVDWSGVHVRVPSPADTLMLTLIHGVRWSLDAAADWTIDASALLDEANLDWDVFLQEANDRMLHAALLSGLVYLRDTLRKRVPDEVIEKLRSESSPEQLAELEQYASTACPANPAHIRAATAMAARRSLLKNNDAMRWPIGELRQEPLTHLAVELPDNRMAQFKIPQPRGDLGWLIIEIAIWRRPPESTEPVIGYLIAPGLPLAIFIGRAQEASQPDSTHAFSIAIPEALLTYRGIAGLGFRYTMAGSHPDLPVYVRISRRSVPDSKAVATARNRRASR